MSKRSILNDKFIKVIEDFKEKHDLSLYDIYYLCSIYSSNIAEEAFEKTEYHEFKRRKC